MNPYLTAVEGLRDMLSAMNGPVVEFKRDKYQKSFDQAYIGAVPVLDAVEQLYNTVLEPDAMIANMAAAIVGEAKERIGKEKKNYRKDQVLLDLNMTMVIFVFPAILRYGGNSSRPLTDAILAAWKEAFPKTNLQAAEFEYINKGFHRKFCYITTAVCETLGRGDDCYELQLFRSYRDDYLQKAPGGEAQILDYYDIAPTIVKHISGTGCSEEIYQDVWDTYLSPCVRLIEDGELEECRDTYTRMVADLKDKYFFL